MKKSMTAVLLWGLFLLCSVESFFIPVYAEAVADITEPIYNSDVEAYANDLYYYVDEDGCVYRETVEHEHKEYITAYGVNQILTDGYLL